MYRILGLPPFGQEPSGDLYNSVVHPDDRVARRDPAGILRTISDRPHRILRSDGQVRWVRSRGRVLHDSSGVPQRAIGVTFDITERMYAEGFFHRESALLDMVQELFGGAVWTAAADGTTMPQVPDLRLAAGPYATVRSGTSRLEDVHPDDLAEVRRQWEEAVRTGGRYAADFRTTWGGTVTEVSSRAVAFHDPLGAVLGWIGYTIPRAQPDGPAVPSPVSSEPTAAQIRGARGLLGWTAGDLAERSGLSFSTIRRAEREGKRVLGLPAINAIRDAFASSGVQFSATSDGGISVSLHPTARLSETRGPRTKKRTKKPPT